MNSHIPLGPPKPGMNRIAGQSCPAASGAEFVPSGSKAGGGSRIQGAWPRSGPRDLERALASLVPGAAEWAQTSLQDRTSWLARARLELARECPARTECARRLGISTQILGDLISGRALRFPGQVCTDFTPGQVALVRLHWSETAHDLLECVGAALLAGCSVLLVSDGAAPEVADWVAFVCLKAGIPAGALALLHDDGDSVPRAALESFELAQWFLSGHESHFPAWVKPPRATTESFGIGVQEHPKVQVHYTQLTGGRRQVGPEADPDKAARQVWADLFTGACSLWGQLPWVPMVVAVAPRILSEFTRLLLGRLERSDVPVGKWDSGHPPHWVQADMASYLDEVLEIGVDGGATLIHRGGWVPCPSEHRSATISRLVFTNVEAEMRLLECTRPAPVLMLQRLQPSS